MSIIVENAKSGVSLCRLCDESMEEGKERFGVKLNARMTNYCHPGCLVETFLVDKTPNNRGKCKLGCGQTLKKDETRMGFRFDPEATLWFHIGCCQKFLEPAKDKCVVTAVAGLADLDEHSQKEVVKHFASAKSGAAVPKKEKPKEEPPTGTEKHETKKRATRTSSKPVAKAKEDIGEDEDKDAEPSAGGDDASEVGDEGDAAVDEGDGEGDAEGDEPDRETEFGCMTSVELRAECKKFGINSWGLNKDKMIKALEEDVKKTNPSKTKAKSSEKDWDPPAEDEGDEPEPKKKKSEGDEPESKPVKKQKK